MSWPGWENFDPRTHNAKTQIEKKRKYRNQPTELDGFTFASKREADRYDTLKSLKSHGVLSDIEVQPKFPLHVTRHDGVRVEIGCYVADFRYRFANDGRVIVEDAKGMKTAIYQWKKKHVEAEYGIEINET